MNSKQFFVKVVQMRQMQKAYYAADPAKRRELLPACKTIEAQIDTEINRVCAIVDLQQMINEFNTPAQ